MKLHYTPRSHYARKVRIVLDGLGIEAELVDAGNVAETSPEQFAGNPLMKVPALVHESTVIIDSDNIVAFLVANFDPQDRFGVRTDEVDMLNARAVMNGIMAAEVEIVLGRRTGIPIEKYSRYAKILESIQRGLAWLEDHMDVFPEEPNYGGFHLVCLWDHLALYGNFELDYPRLRAEVARVSKLPYVAQSAPTPRAL